MPDDDEDGGEIVLILILVLLIILLIFASAYIPNFWMVSCILLVGILSYFTYLEYFNRVAIDHTNSDLDNSDEITL